MKILTKSKIRGWSSKVIGTNGPSFNTLKPHSAARYPSHALSRFAPRSTTRSLIRDRCLLPMHMVGDRCFTTIAESEGLWAPTSISQCGLEHNATGVPAECNYLYLPPSNAGKTVWPRRSAPQMHQHSQHTPDECDEMRGKGEYPWK